MDRKRALAAILMAGIKAKYIPGDQATDAAFELECDVPGVGAGVQIVSGGRYFVPTVEEGEGDDWGVIHYATCTDPVFAAQYALRMAETFR